MRRPITLFSILFLLLAPVLGAVACKTYEIEISFVTQEFIVLEDDTGERVVLRNSYCATDRDENHDQGNHNPQTKGSCSYCLTANSYSLEVDKLEIGALLFQNISFGSFQERARDQTTSSRSARAPPISAQSSSLIFAI